MKRALITGVSRGIGKATAENFLDEGWHVIGTSTSGKSPIKHTNLEMHRLNLLDLIIITDLISKIRGTKLDLLINNAAISDEPQAEAINAEELRKVLEVNLIGLVDLTENLLPFINDGGQIINISSGSGSLSEFKGVWAQAYSISKAALNMYTRILADRLQNRDIIVSSVTPGWVRTDMGGPRAPRDPSEPAQEIYELATSRVESGQFWGSGRKKAW